MTPAERLQAAIDTLTRLKAESTPGPWGYYTPRGKDGHPDPIFGATPGDEVAWSKRPADWHLIVTLHRTIDAQLAILRTEHERCSTPFAGMFAIPDDQIIALADAILGGAA